MPSIVRGALDFAKDVVGFGFSTALQGFRSEWGSGTLTLHPRDLEQSIFVRRGDSDYRAFKQIFLRKEYALGEDAEDIVKLRYDAILGAGDIPVIVDAGANIGLTSIWFSTHYPKATIVAIEPDATNHAMLVRNTAELGNVIPLHSAIGSKAGLVDVNLRSGQSWASTTARSESGSTKIITIMDAVRRVPRGIPLIVKIDIEGFEYDLFADNLSWLDEACCVFVEPHDWLFPTGATSRSFQKAFGSRNFGLFIHGENLVYLNDKFLLGSIAGNSGAFNSDAHRRKQSAPRPADR